MSISQNAVAAREAARSKTGEFGHQNHSESGVSLDAPGRPVPELDKLHAGLDRLGLTVDDVPGLQDAWAEHFAALNTPARTTGQLLAGDIFKDIELEDYERGPFLKVRTADPDTGRHGWGVDATRELLSNFDPQSQSLVAVCWGEIYENDDGYYDTDAALLSVPTSHPAYLDSSAYGDELELVLSVPHDRIPDLIAAQDGDQKHAADSALRGTANLVAQGEIPPWSVMDGGTTDRVETWEIRRLLQDAQQRDAQAQDLEKEMNYLMGVGESSGLDRIAGLHRVQITQAKDSCDRAMTTFTAAQAQVDQARALPEGELRSWLLDDRPERSYETTEGHGRSKKKVTKTYIPKSEFMEHYESARSSMDRASAEYNSVCSTISTAHASAVESAESARAQADQLQDRRIENWYAGWPGDREDCPPAEWMDAAHH